MHCGVNSVPDGRSPTTAEAVLMTQKQWMTREGTKGAEKTFYVETVPLMEDAALTLAMTLA